MITKVDILIENAFAEILDCKISGICYIANFTLTDNFFSFSQITTARFELRIVTWPYLKSFSIAKQECTYIPFSKFAKSCRDDPLFDSAQLSEFDYTYKYNGTLNWCDYASFSFARAYPSWSQDFSCQMLRRRYWWLTISKWRVK